MDGKRCRLEGKEEEEDRISDLPDCLIEHILSFLASTKECVRTSVLSKRWRNQWTRVPVVLFKFIGMTCENYSRFVTNTLKKLDDCSSKIVKFELDSHPHDPNWLNEMTRWATRKGVEELILNRFATFQGYRLPEFVFENASLLKLETNRSNINGKVNSRSLKTLKITQAWLSKQVTEDVASGCPVLESLELSSCPSFNRLLVVASKSLKRLCLDGISGCSVIEISCPNLEVLTLWSCVDARTFRLMDMPYLVSVTLDYYWNLVVKDILQLLQHVKELTFGASFIKALSALDVSSQLFNSKCSSLTLNYIHFGDSLPGIVYALRNSPSLEQLVLKLSPRDANRKLCNQNRVIDDLCGLKGFEESYWSSNGWVFKFNRLKTVKIIGLRERPDSILHFIQFLLKNAKVLQKIFIILEDPWFDINFVSKVSHQLSNLPRASPHAIVELYMSNRGGYDIHII